MYRVSRSFQKIFRQKITSRDRSCLITSAPPIVCEAAHIVEVKNHKKHPNPDFTKCKPGCDIKPSLDGNCDDDIKKGPNGKCFKTCYSGCSNRTFSDTKCNYDSDCKENCPSMKVYHGVSCDNQKPPVPGSTSAKKFVENLSMSR